MRRLGKIGVKDHLNLWNRKQFFPPPRRLTPGGLPGTAFRFACPNSASGPTAVGVDHSLDSDLMPNICGENGRPKRNGSNGQHGVEVRLNSPDSLGGGSVIRTLVPIRDHTLADH